MRQNGFAIERHRPPQIVDPRPIAGRVPPHDLDSEGITLSACFLDRTSLEKVLEILKPEHFYSGPNARIFQAMQQLVAAGTPVDVVTVTRWLRDREWRAPEGTSWGAYLRQLESEMPAVVHVAPVARIVHEKWRLRQLAETCNVVSAHCYGDVGEVQKFIDGAHASVGAIAATEPKALRGSVTSDVADDVVAQIEESLTGRVSGTSWGWAPVDERVGLMMPKGYYIIPARSGHGKTQFVTQTALNIVEAPPRDDYANVVYLGSFEMPSVVLLKRTICTEAEVSFKRVNAGKISHERRFDFDGGDCPECGAGFRPQTLETLPMVHGAKACPDCRVALVPGASEQERLKAAMMRLRRTQIVWDDRRCTPAELAVRVRAVQERAEAGTLTARDGTTLPKGKVRAVMVDYLQKMPAPQGPHNRSRQGEVAAISMGLLEDVAKGCNVPVVALAQINRLVDKQKDSRPTLADIREAGDIEQDADEIIAIHREQYRLREKTPLEWQNIAELIHLKGRGGLDADLAPAKMWFVQGRFHSVPPDERICAYHAQQVREAGADVPVRDAVMYETRSCPSCYRDSWAVWAERVGVKDVQRVHNG